jgi:simple sugar transport system permease protein
MGEFDVIILLASVVAGATPIVLAALGETITEKSGTINLALDGTILLSAMTAFAVAYESNSLIFGFISAALVGAGIAMLVSVFSLYLGQSQVAVGFVLTLMTRDLAYFVGNAYSRIQGPQIAPLPIPGLAQIPFIGPVLFTHNILVYLSLVLIFFCWWYIYRTPMGLQMRSVGELPKSSFARGIHPTKLQFGYAVCGGMLVGLAGAAFSLFTKPGWGRPQGAEGSGWIALALVIFGGWHPVRAAIGAYLFSFLQVMGIYFQGWFPSIPAQVFQVAPFPIMIFTLIIMHVAQKESVVVWAEDHSWAQPLLRVFSGTAPMSLGKPYQRD